MTYLASMSVEETSHNQSPASIRVSWAFGDQRPDEVQVYLEPGNATAPDSASLAVAVPVDQGGGHPTTADVGGVPAPAQWRVFLAPRLLDSQGVELDQMPDGSGGTVYWESLVLTRVVSLTGAPVGNPGGAPAQPKIAGVDRSRGRFVVHWDSAPADHFNVRVDSATDHRGQDEIPGNWRELGVDFAEAGVYVFGIQACNRHILTGVSDCSAWVSTEIVVTPGQDWRTQDVVIDPAAGFAVAAQDQAAPGQLDLVTVDHTGTLLLALRRQDWEGWLPLTPPGVAAPQSAVVMASQLPNAQLDVIFVGPDRRLQVMWVTGHDRWNGPLPLHDVAIAPPGAELAAVHQPPNDQLDVFVVGDDGALRVLWEVDEHTWSTPLSLTAAGFAPAGASVAAAQQTPNDQLDVFVVADDGSLQLVWEVDNGQWKPPIALSPPGFAPPGAPLVAVRQFPLDQLNVFVVGNDGALHVTWVEGEGNWQGPAALGPAGLAVPGAHIGAHTLGQQSRLDVVVPGADHRLYVFTVHDAGAWQGPAALGDPVLSDHTRVVVLDSGDVYARGSSGHFLLASVTGQPPVPVSEGPAASTAEPKKRLGGTLQMLRVLAMPYPDHKSYRPGWTPTLQS